MDDSTGSEWTMLPSSSNHEQQQQQQQQEKKASQLFAQRALQERRLKPPDQVIACPRCQSLNTKFCYYNNYSLTQPRHFCKSCRRYWTAGGTLRNVPVGGGCRKNKRTKPRTPDAASSGGAVSSDSDHSLSVGPGLQHHHQGFGGSGGFLDSSEGSYAGVEQSVRVTQDPSGEGSLSFPFHLNQPAPLSQHMHMHPFEAGIPGINFFRGPRPETTLNLHPSPGDLSSIFDTSNVPRPGGLTSSLSEGLVSFSSNHPGYPVAGVDQQSSTYAGLEAWRAHQAQHAHAHAPSSVWGNEAMQGEVDMKRQQVNF